MKLYGIRYSVGIALALTISSCTAQKSAAPMLPQSATDERLLTSTEKSSGAQQPVISSPPINVAVSCDCGTAAPKEPALGIGTLLIGFISSVGSWLLN